MVALPGSFIHLEAKCIKEDVLMGMSIQTDEDAFAVMVYSINAVIHTAH
jgi:hypothetical protein